MITPPPPSTGTPFRAPSPLTRGGRTGARALAVVLLAVLTGCAVPPTLVPPAPGESTQQPVAEALPAGESTAAGLLGTLQVKGRAPKTGYDREQFGPAWADTDRNGCDTRNDVLRRDLTEVTFRAETNECVVSSGTLADPFSGSTIHFVRGQGTSERVQVDHVVALSDAWQKGARQWTPEQRRAFANDPLNLLAVDGPLNGQKGDGDAATWLPPNGSFRCEYVALQIAVKAKYGAWVTSAERDAIAGVLQTCPGQPVPVADTAVTDTAEQAPATPAPAAPGGTCDPSYPGVCIPPVSEAGDLDCTAVPDRGFAVVAPDPHGFDADGDGVGCAG